MSLACPSCGSKNLRFSHRQSAWESFLSIFGYCTVRCRDCLHRYREGIVWLPGMGYAKCPRCLREDLADWEEKYAYPPRWQQSLLHIGAKAHRCAVCRLNFVSFLRRRSQFVGSWKLKQQQANEVAAAEARPQSTPPPEVKEKTVA